ncbi:hypothetical protein [Bosea sp. BIWAKO-01]|nr:hypothetical protein [Bosea sp. BIWAKO-01]GAU86581.1 hypothetical protein BIWAKO_06529 [Bosea sp. BIWAKO-01]
MLTTCAPAISGMAAARHQSGEIDDIGSISRAGGRRVPPASG